MLLGGILGAPRGRSWGGPGGVLGGVQGGTGKGQGLQGRARGEGQGPRNRGGRVPGALGPPFPPCFGLLAFPPGPSLDLLAVHHIALMESVAEVKSVRFRMSGFLFGALCAPLLSLAIDLGAAIPKNPSAPDYL